MNLTLADSLHIPPLDRCRLLGGARGLHRSVTSINIVDTPEMTSFLKPGELLLTTGSGLGSDPETQVSLVREVSLRGCAGLALKTLRPQPAIPGHLVRAANEHDLPLIEIPHDLTWPDLMLPLMGEILTRRSQPHVRDRCHLFFSRLLQGELQDPDLILAQGQPFGLRPGSEYVCIIARTAQSRHKCKGALLRAVTEAVSRSHLSIMTLELEDVIMILQLQPGCGSRRAASLARSIAEQVLESYKRQLAEPVITLGIGTLQPDVRGIPTSYREAQEAALLGRCVPVPSPGGVCEYADVIGHALLRHVPMTQQSEFVKSTLGRLIEYDRQNNADLVHTLQVYLSTGGRPSETARLLFLHRNTVQFRLSRIAEILEADLANGETLFRLHLALRFLSLATTLECPVTRAAR